MRTEAERDMAKDCRGHQLGQLAEPLAGDGLAGFGKPGFQDPERAHSCCLKPPACGHCCRSHGKHHVGDGAGFWEWNISQRGSQGGMW